MGIQWADLAWRHRDDIPTKVEIGGHSEGIERGKDGREYLSIDGVIEPFAPEIGETRNLDSFTRLATSVYLSTPRTTVSIALDLG